MEAGSELQSDFKSDLSVIESERESGGNIREEKEGNCTGLMGFVLDSGCIGNLTCVHSLYCKVLIHHTAFSTILSL